MLCAVVVVCYLGFPHQLQAAKTYQEPTAYVKDMVPNGAAKVVRLNSALKSRIDSLNGGSFRPSRVRYWKEGGRTVWVLEEIGKTEPITVGFTVDNGKMSNVKVLVYRESHGYEVSYKYFTKRLRSLHLDKSGDINKRISNIAGATLSVRAMTKMARVALVLDQAVR